MTSPLSRKKISDAPPGLNINDKAFWVRGWNEAVAALAAQPVQDEPADGEFVLRVKQYKDCGWWAIQGPVGSGLLIAHPSLDVCMGDVLPSWRMLARIAPSQVPPVPDASLQPAPVQDERASFEAWRDQHYAPRPLLFLRAMDPAVAAWEAWQARAAMSASSERLAKLEECFREIGRLIVDHDVLADTAVVYPCNLDKVFKKVDPQWYASAGKESDRG